MKNNKTKGQKKSRKQGIPSSGRSPIFSKGQSAISYQLCSQQQNQITPLSNRSLLQDFNTNPPIVLQTLPLYKYHKQSITLKHKIIKTLVFTFYSIEEYAFISYVCFVIQEKFKNVVGVILGLEKYKNHQHRAEADLQEQLTVKKDQLIAKFLDAQKYMQSLKQSRMIMDSQKDVGFIKINNKFFNMLNSICEDLLKKVNQQQKQLVQVQKVTCKGCGVKRHLYQIQAKVSCQCGSKQIVAQKDSSQAKQTMQILTDQINSIKKLKSQLDQSRKKQIQRIHLERNKNYQSHRVTDVDKDILQATKYIQKQGSQLISPWLKFPIKKNGVFIRMTESQFAPKRQYEKIKQLGQARKRRKVQKSIQFL